MRRLILLGLVATMTLTACGTVRESRLNPFNWFGGSREAPAQPVQSDNPLIPQRTGFLGSRREADIYTGVPVEVIRDVVVERVPGGAIVRATGVSRFQNIYDIRLTPANEDEVPVDGVLDYRLEARIPERPIAGGSENLRSVIVARSLTDQQLEGVRQIRVSGTQNAQVSRRR